MDTVVNKDDMKLTTGKTPFVVYCYLTFFAVVLELALVYGIGMIENSRANKITDQQAQVQSDITTKYGDLNNSVEQVIKTKDYLGTALNNKINWTKFYADLNAVTPKNVRIASLTLNEAGVFQMSAETDSYTSLAQAIVILNNGAGTVVSPFNSATLSSNTVTSRSGKTVVSFNVTGKVKMGSYQNTK